MSDFEISDDDESFEGPAHNRKRLQSQSKSNRSASLGQKKSGSFFGGGTKDDENLYDFEYDDDVFTKLRSPASASLDRMSDTKKSTKSSGTLEIIVKAPQSKNANPRNDEDDVLKMANSMLEKYSRASSAPITSKTIVKKSYYEEDDIEVSLSDDENSDGNHRSLDISGSISPVDLKKNKPVDDASNKANEIESISAPSRKEKAVDTASSVRVKPSVSAIENPHVSTKSLTTSGHRVAFSHSKPDIEDRSMDASSEMADEVLSEGSGSHLSPQHSAKDDSRLKMATLGAGTDDEDNEYSAYTYTECDEEEDNEENEISSVGASPIKNKEDAASDSARAATGPVASILPVALDIDENYDDDFEDPMERYGVSFPAADDVENNEGLTEEAGKRQSLAIKNVPEKVYQRIMQFDSSLLPDLEIDEPLHMQKQDEQATRQINKESVATIDAAVVENVHTLSFSSSVPTAPTLAPVATFQHAETPHAGTSYPTAELTGTAAQQQHQIPNLPTAAFSSFSHSIPHQLSHQQQAFSRLSTAPQQAFQTHQQQVHLDPSIPVGQGPAPVSSSFVFPQNYSSVQPQHPASAHTAMPEPFHHQPPYPYAHPAYTYPGPYNYTYNAPPPPHLFYPYAYPPSPLSMYASASLPSFPFGYGPHARASLGADDLALLRESAGHLPLSHNSLLTASMYAKARDIRATEPTASGTSSAPIPPSKDNTIIQLVRELEDAKREAKWAMSKLTEILVATSGNLNRPAPQTVAIDEAIHRSAPTVTTQDTDTTATTYISKDAPVPSNEAISAVQYGSQGNEIKDNISVTIAVPASPLSATCTEQEQKLVYAAEANGSNAAANADIGLTSGNEETLLRPQQACSPSASRAIPGSAWNRYANIGATAVETAIGLDDVYEGKADKTSAIYSRARPESFALNNGESLISSHARFRQQLLLLKHRLSLSTASLGHSLRVSMESDRGVSVTRPNAGAGLSKSTDKITDLLERLQPQLGRERARAFVDAARFS